MDGEEPDTRHFLCAMTIFNLYLIIKLDFDELGTVWTVLHRQNVRMEFDSGFYHVRLEGKEIGREGSICFSSDF